MLRHASSQVPSSACVDTSWASGASPLLTLLGQNSNYDETATEIITATANHKRILQRTDELI
jgi:hypothetical protein